MMSGEQDPRVGLPALSAEELESQLSILCRDIEARVRLLGVEVVVVFVQKGSTQTTVAMSCAEDDAVTLLGLARAQMRERIDLIKG